MTPQVTYWIVCLDYEVGPKRTREAAEKAMKEIELSGNCTNRHMVVEKVHR
jgi:hypothetical protein